MESAGRARGCCKWAWALEVEPSLTLVFGMAAQKMMAELLVGVVTGRAAPTLVASNVGCSSGSYSLDKTLLFFHFDIESI